MKKIDSLDRTIAQDSLDPYTPTNSYFSEGIIRRSLWGIGGITSLVGAANFDWSFPLSPLTLMSLAAVCVYNAYITHNYDSTTEIAQYEKECKNSSLEKALKNHGKYVFARQLLTPQEVEQKYLEKESKLQTIPSILNLYTTAESLRKAGDPENRYSLPSPSRLKEKFQKICSFLSFQEIEKTHSLEKIFSWELLSKEDFFSKYKDYQHLLLSTNGIKAVIAHYQKIQETQKDFLNKSYYEIPHPKQLKSAWYKTLQGMSINELATHCSLEQLIDYEIVTEAEQIQKLQLFSSKLNSLKTSYSTQLRLIEEMYTKNLKDADSLLDREKRTIYIAKEAIAQKKLEINRQVEYLKERILWASERNDPILAESLKKDLSQLTTSQAWTTLINTLLTETDLESHLEKAIRQHAETTVKAEEHRKSSKETLEKEYATTLAKLEDDFSKFKKSLLQD